jgi:hypothetical protein
MAKDGTARGNRKGNMTHAGDGRSKVPLPPAYPNAEGKVPPPDDLPDFMTAKQRMGGDLDAANIYADTLAWLEERGCAGAVTQEMLIAYAMEYARWIQIQRIINETGFMAKHPTTDNPILSPFLKAAQEHMKAVNLTWYPIFQAVQAANAARYGAVDEGDDVDLLTNPHG